MSDAGGRSDAERAEYVSECRHHRLRNIFSAQEQYTQELNSITRVIRCLRS